jgi:GNAT superfamily N-acetyltransferase
MTAAFRIRRYEPADFPALASLAVEASSAPETACGQPDVASVAEFEVDYAHRPLEQEAWVAVDARGVVVGFTAGQTRGGVLMVDGPIVAPAHRRQGIGRALYQRLEQDAEAAGAHLVEVGVRSTNAIGDAFLGAIGCGTHREIYVYEAHSRMRVEPRLPAGYHIEDLKPRTLLPFLMVMHECFPGYRLPSTPQRLFEPERMKIVLASDAAGRVAGALTAFYYPEDGHGYLYHLGVSEAHRSKGLARGMIVAACDWLWDTHRPHLIGASTSIELGARQRLFHPLGFALQYSLRYARKALDGHGDRTG